ncbi:ATP-binding protein [Candidatus Azambacteria bacterium]|nr:ATP-binding protein [Candidatus Azambacteria bacterium]
MKYITRYLEDSIIEIHRTFKVLYVGGPRQVGKTTTLRKLAKKLGVNYITLDDRIIRELALRDPHLFLEQYPSPLFIDEVQYAPGLFSEIKVRVDASDQCGRYWLTGSEQFAMMKNIRESLAGRVGILTLLGFSHAEIKGVKKIVTPFLNPKQILLRKKGDSINDIFTEIHRGSFPGLYQLNSPQTEIFYNSYIQTYLERDIAQLFHVAKLANFEIFLQLCAARTGQILNMSDLARDAGISLHAASEWLSILESSRQIYLLRPYYTNIPKRLVKMPKLYFLDTGLAAYLTRWNSPPSLQSGAMKGAFFETFVIIQIIKSYLYRGIEPPLFYVRDKDGHEIDLIIQREQKLFPIEIKCSANISTDDLVPIRFWRQAGLSLGQGSIICAVDKVSVFDKDTRLIPCHAIT